jgi:flagellar FliJ protein
MAFKFRYKSLLSYRQHLKEKAEIELALAQRQLNRAQELLKYFSESLKKGNAELDAALSKTISSDDLKVYLDYLSGLKIRIEIQTAEVQKCKEKVKKKMETLLEKTKEYKVIEKLKQNDFEKWDYKQLQEERKAMNETAILRYKQEVPQ